MKKLNARSVLTFVGVLMGVGGATHGPGEILQGNVAPSGVYIQAWPALTLLGGEPAMTLIPNFLVTGVLAIILGLAVAVWAAKYLHGKNGGFVLVVLSLVMLLVGGGIVPPIIEVTIGIISILINRSNFVEAENS